MFKSLTCKKLSLDEIRGAILAECRIKPRRAINYIHGRTIPSENENLGYDDRDHWRDEIRWRLQNFHWNVRHPLFQRFLLEEIRPNATGL